MCTTVSNLYNLPTEIFKPRLFCWHATSHKGDWIHTTDCCLLSLALLYASVFSLVKVFGVERAGFCLYDNSLAIFFSCLLLLVYVFDVFVSVYLCCMYCVHIVSCSVRFRCVSLCISFSPIIFVLVAFAYWFLVKSL